MDKRYFSEKVVEWYLQNKRTLPWRDTGNAYFIWLSEIILQQTRVNQGLPYYLKFVETFPTVADLAAASEQQILRLWQGLGYYTRARNLHKCAKAVVNQHQGVFPDQYEKLIQLPGIGDYTAAAIASIAYKEAVAVVDGNVFRVLSRVFGIDVPINQPLGKKEFAALASALVAINSKQPDVHNQAMMEFGALFCTPKNPSCSSCALAKGCFAFKHELQDGLPVKLKSKAARQRYFFYVVYTKGRSLLMKKREQKDIWHGLYDFHLIEKNRATKVESVINEDQVLKKYKRDQVVISEPYKHVLTHQIIRARFIMVPAPKSIKEKDARFFTSKQVSDLPKPVLITSFLKDHDLL